MVTHAETAPTPNPLIGNLNHAVFVFFSLLCRFIRADPGAAAAQNEQKRFNIYMHRENLGGVVDGSLTYGAVCILIFLYMERERER